MKYTIETIPYTQQYHYATLKEAKRKASENGLQLYTNDGNGYQWERQKANRCDILREDVE